MVGAAGGETNASDAAVKRQQIVPPLIPTYDNEPIPFPEDTLALLGVVAPVAGEVSSVVAESGFMVEVEEVLPNPLVRGARWVSFNSVAVSAIHRLFQSECKTVNVLFVSFQDILSPGRCPSHKVRCVRSRESSSGVTLSPGDSLSCLLTQVVEKSTSDLSDLDSVSLAGRLISISGDRVEIAAHEQALLEPGNTVTRLIGFAKGV